MKKTSHKKRLYQVRKSRRGARLQFSQRYTLRIPKQKTSQVASCLTILTPEKFSILDEQWREKLFLFFDEVECALARGRTVQLKFDAVKELHTCGTLVFMSRLDIWLTRYSGKLSCSYPTEDVVEQLFQHVDVLSKLGLPSRKVINHKHVAYWHFYTGTNVDPSEFVNLTRSVIEQIDSTESNLFADCLNEAIANTVHHAYRHFSESKLAKESRKWWIFSQYTDGKLSLVVYDAGEGIPKSLRRKPELREYLKLRHYNDARTIESAILSNRTRTKQVERGKGLPEMFEFSQKLYDGGLSIWSGRGGWRYDAQNKSTKRYNFRHELLGTLIQWTIPFRKEYGNAKKNDINS